ncbi:MAG: hypothetical protein IJS54_00970 [Desulfovibrio sp.]|nr:hypothetical protein [Desulfovibrio sp.]
MSGLVQRPLRWVRVRGRPWCVGFSWWQVEKGLLGGLDSADLWQCRWGGQVGLGMGTDWHAPKESRSLAVWCARKHRANVLILPLHDVFGEEFVWLYVRFGETLIPVVCDSCVPSTEEAERAVAAVADTLNTGDMEVVCASSVAESLSLLESLPLCLWGGRIRAGCAKASHKKYLLAGFLGASLCIGSAFFFSPQAPPQRVINEPLPQQGACASTLSAILPDLLAKPNTVSGWHCTSIQLAVGTGRQDDGALRIPLTLTIRYTKTPFSRFDALPKEAVVASDGKTLTTSSSLFMREACPHESLADGATIPHKLFALANRFHTQVLIRKREVVFPTIAFGALRPLLVDLAAIGRVRVVRMRCMGGSWRLEGVIQTT